MTGCKGFGKDGYGVKEVRSAKADGEKPPPGMFYILKDGGFVPAGEE
jgi:hypothetical protein